MSRAKLYVGVEIKHDTDNSVVASQRTYQKVNKKI